MSYDILHLFFSIVVKNVCNIYVFDYFDSLEVT